MVLRAMITLLVSISLLHITATPALSTLRLVFTKSDSHTLIELVHVGSVFTTSVCGLEFTKTTTH